MQFVSTLKLITLLICLNIFSHIHCLVVHESSPSPEPEEIPIPTKSPARKRQTPIKSKPVTPSKPLQSQDVVQIPNNAASNIPTNVYNNDNLVTVSSTRIEVAPVAEVIINESPKKTAKKIYTPTKNSAGTDSFDCRKCNLKIAIHGRAIMSNLMRFQM